MSKGRRAIRQWRHLVVFCQPAVFELGRDLFLLPNPDDSIHLDASCITLPSRLRLPAAIRHV